MDYSYYEAKSKDLYSRHCIDGSIAGCSKCVGFCQYKCHQGFLTDKLRKKHRCIEKNCFYYLPKPASPRKGKTSKVNSHIFDIVFSALSEFEGLRPMQVDSTADGRYIVKYITVTNSYSIPAMEARLTAILGGPTKMLLLNYSFDLVCQLLLS